MKKTGVIPPHLMYFLQNEGIEVINFCSSNFISKDSYDRFIVKFPFGVTTIDIQVIFDNTDSSSPPDFILLNNFDYIIDYDQIISEWVFRDSSSLYNSLLLIKKIYEEKQQQKLLEIISHAINKEKEYQGNKENSNYPYILEMYNFIKSCLDKYRNLPKNNRFLDVQLIYNNNEKFSNNFNNIKGQLTSVKLSYPLDCLIRSREINRTPILCISININFQNDFTYDLILPNFVSYEVINLKKSYGKLSNFKQHIKYVEQGILDSCSIMRNREFVITKIIESNIGYPIQIDTLGFLTLILYFHHSKTVINQTQNQNINNFQNNQSKTSKNLDFNFLIYFLFNKDDNTKLELQIVDCDQLTILQRKKIDFGISEREINNVLHFIASNIMDCIQTKKKPQK